MPSVFGTYLRRLREERGYGLREFCKKIHIDASNYSKYERGALEPPQEDQLRRIAGALGIAVGTPDWSEFTHYADAGRGEVPADLPDRERFLELLPVLFQRVRDGGVPGDVDPIEALEKLLLGERH